MTTPKHQFVQGIGFPDGEGCAFIVDGHGWTITDPICCRKSRKEHEAMTTPTPRTDAEELDGAKWDDHRVDRVVPANFARQLERNLAAREAELAEWKRKAEEAAKDAVFGQILMRYIDRLDDPTSDDTVEIIASELSADVHRAIAALAAKGEA